SLRGAAGGPRLGRRRGGGLQRVRRRGAAGAAGADAVAGAALDRRAGLHGQGGHAVGVVLRPRGGAVPDGGAGGPVPALRPGDLRRGVGGVLLRAGAEVPPAAPARPAGAAGSDLLTSRDRQRALTEQ